MPIQISVAIYGDTRLGASSRGNGIGMSPLELIEARKRFGQVERVESRTYSGSGLGIPIAIELPGRERRPPSKPRAHEFRSSRAAPNSVQHRKAAR